MAEVLKTKSNVRISPLPPTIRVDAMTARTSTTRRCSRLLCEDPGYVAAAPFEEIRSIW